MRTINWLILIIKQVSVDEEDDDEDDDAAKVCADLGFFLSNSLWYISEMS